MLALSHKLTKALAPSAPPPTVGEEDWLAPGLRAIGVAPDQLESLLAHWRREKVRANRLSLGAVAVSIGILSAQTYAEMLANHFGLPFCRDYRKVASAKSVVQLPTSVARRCLSWILAVSEGTATVILADPSPARLEELQQALEQMGLRGKRRFTHAYNHDFRVAAEGDVLAAIEERHFEGDRSVGDASGRKCIESWIRAAIIEEASDIHFVPKESAVEVRFRVDGRLWTKQIVGGDRKDEVIANAKMFGGLDVGRKLEPLDGSVRFELGAKSYKLRFSSIPTQFGQQVVIRILDQNASVLPFKSLGIGTRDAIAIQEAMSLPQGLVFMVGPTGSGKTTTLASLISQLDGQSYSIRTLENPVEYRLANAVQTEVSEEMGFARGLRALLRQDPDYVLVGETRDLETAEIAIEAGLTGHMCFSTLHGNDGIGGIVRLLDLGVEPGPMLAACHLFIAQRLVRRLCLKCARPSENSAALIRRHGLLPQAGQQLWEPVGCPECRDGFRGRIGIYETRWLRDFETQVQVGGSACAPKCREIVRERGLGSMREDGFAKALQGVTTVDEVLSQIVG